MELVILLLFIISAVYIFLYYRLKSRIVRLTDKMPGKENRRYMVLKLQNELQSFVQREEDRVVLFVVRPKKKKA